MRCNNGGKVMKQPLPLYAGKPQYNGLVGLEIERYIIAVKHIYISFPLGSCVNDTFLWFRLWSSGYNKSLKRNKLEG